MVMISNWCEVIRMVNRAEYKRQQAAPGLKISPKAFGSGRRLPIAAKQREVENERARTPSPTHLFWGRVE